MPSPKSGTAGTAVTPADAATAQEADDAQAGSMAQNQENPAQTQAGQTDSASTDTLDSPAATQPYKPPATAEDKAAKQSWIEVELLYDNGDPVAGESYKITLPDGSTVAEGTLDEKGFVRIDGVDPGTCQVTFPNLDGRDWNRK